MQTKRYSICNFKSLSSKIVEKGTVAHHRTKLLTNHFVHYTHQSNLMTQCKDKNE